MKNLLILLLAVFTTFAYGQQITQIEYFFDTDPGYGQGNSLSITPSEDIDIDQLVDITALSAGTHVFNVRMKDESGDWSSVLSRPFYIDQNNGQEPVIDYIEYFVDDDPGYGNGIPYTDFNAALMLDETFLASMTGIAEGQHSFSIRMRSETPLWSQILVQSFELLDCDLNIMGEITDQSGSAVSSGMVVLLQYFGSGSAIGVDTVYLSDGSYHFSSVCPHSDYYVKVLPNEEDAFLATYYGDSPYWQDAELISIDEGSQNGKDIIINDFSEMEAGSSSLGGHIYYLDAKGEPVKNIEVVLELDDPLDKEGFVPVAYDITDVNGQWQIDDLPLADYKIYVEITGLEMDTTYVVEITAPDTHIHHLDYYVDFNTGIFIDYSAVHNVDLAESLRFFPNPNTTGRLWIDAENPDIRIQEIIIYRYSGQAINDIEVRMQGNSMDVSRLSKGFYVVQILTNKGMIIKKLIIQ